MVRPVGAILLGTFVATPLVLGVEQMMFPGGIERALGIAEISEWFDWMRREIPSGGIALPPEETAASFAGHALRLRNRIRDIYHHLPLSLENSLIESMIVYQCWERHKGLYGKAAGVRQNASLLTVEAEQYVRPVGAFWGYHLVKGGDGFRYLITVPTGLNDETIPATEIICNRLARLVGLTVSDVAVVSFEGKLLRGDDARPGRAHRTPRRAPELCAGFRYPEPHHPGRPLREKPFPLDRRNTRHLMGALVFDTWTLNLSPRQWSSDFSQATGRIETALVGDAGGLSGGDWGRFLSSTHHSLPGLQAVAARVKRWDQIGPWIGKMAGADLNPIWELAFQMPPLWYGGSRQTLSHVLDKLGRRQWDLSRALHNFIREGYLPALKAQPSHTMSAPEAWQNFSESA